MQKTKNILTKRLEAIVSFIGKTDTFTDIGTDHGYLPIYLLKNNICQKAVVTDINPKPLKKAEINFSKFNVYDKAEFREGSGFAAIGGEDELECVCIAGMGGILITDILGKEKARCAKKLILQPASREEYLRSWLCSNGFYIKNETVTFENNKFYLTFDAVWDGEIRNQNKTEELLGKFIAKRDDEHSKKYIAKKIARLEKVLISLKNGTNEKNIKKREFEDVLFYLKNCT